MAAGEPKLECSGMPDDAMMMAIMSGAEIDSKEVMAYINSEDNAWTLWLHSLSLIDESNDLLSAVRLLTWCVKSDALSDDASVHSTHLQLLYELGQYDDLHSQCSLMSCCLATEVMQHMVREQQKCVKLVFEIFVLQDLLCPEKLCCTQKLLESWFEVLIVELSDFEEIGENINKMLTIAETASQMLVFLRALVSKFGSKLLTLSVGLASKLILQLHSQISATTLDANRPSLQLMHLAEACDLLGRLHPDEKMRQSCAQSAFHLIPTDERASCLSSDSYDSSCTSQGLIIDDHNLLQVVDSLREPGLGQHKKASGVDRRENTIVVKRGVCDGKQDCSVALSDIGKTLANSNEIRGFDVFNNSKARSAFDTPSMDVLWKKDDIEVRLESSECSEDDSSEDVCHSLEKGEAKTNFEVSSLERISIKIKSKAEQRVSSVKKRSQTKQVCSDLGTRERRFFKTTKTRVSSRKVAFRNFAFVDEAEFSNGVKSEVSAPTMVAEVRVQNCSASSNGTISSAKDSVSVKKSEYSQANESTDDQMSRRKPKNVRLSKDASDRQSLDSATVKDNLLSNADQWDTVVDKVGCNGSKFAEENELGCSNGVKINCKFEPLSASNKSSQSKDIWMPYRDSKDRKAPKKLILKRRRSSDVDGDVVGSRKKVVDTEIQRSSTSRPLVNGKRKHRPSAKNPSEDAVKSTPRRRHGVVKKEPLVGGKTAIRPAEVEENENLPAAADVKLEISDVEIIEADDSLQARQTNEEVFKKISREAGSGLACQHCKGELRTRAQLMRHAKGTCPLKGLPSQSDGESSDSARAPVKQRRASDVVTVSVLRSERNRRHTIEVQNSDPVVVEQNPIVIEKDELNQKPIVIEKQEVVENLIAVDNSTVVEKPIVVENSTVIEDKEVEEKPIVIDIEKPAMKLELSAPNEIELKNFIIDINSEVKVDEDRCSPMEEGSLQIADHKSPGIISSNSDLIAPEVSIPTDAGLVLTDDLPSPRNSCLVSPIIPIQHCSSINIVPSESTVQCVCDGCGEVVPDCSWLTAHIVTCPGRSGPADEAAAEEVEPETRTPAWTDEQPDLPEIKESILECSVSAEDSGNQTSTEVDAAGLLQLLRSVENSLLYGNSTGSTACVTDDVVDSTDIINSSEPKSSAVVELVEDTKDKDAGALGRIVSYNGIEMYEFSEYKCGGCPLTFADKLAAERHTSYSVDHGGSAVQRQPVYVCMQCDMRCRQQRLVWFHVTYICHKSIVDESEESTQTPEDLYRCTMCTKLFFAADYLRRHIHLNHPSAVQISAAGTAVASAPTNGSHFGLAAQLLSDWNDYCPPHDGGDGKQTSSNANSHQQALLDLACSMVLDGICPVSSASTEPNAGTVSSTLQTSANVSSLPIRRTAKGIVYKNVFMQCIVSYICSNCSRDLSAKSAKRDHRALAPSTCFDSGPGGRRLFTYVRHYTYLCPYCGDRGATQKACRAHQLTVCLPRMGVKTDELNHKQLLCPFCQRKYFNIITLKGHMTLVHQVSRAESAALIANATGGVIGEELLSLLPEGSILSGMSALGSSESKLAAKGLSGKSTAKRPSKPGNVENGLVLEKRSKENEDDGFAEDVDSYASGSVSQDSQFETVDPSVSLFGNKVSNDTPVIPHDRSTEKHEPVSSQSELNSTQSRSVFRRRPSSSWQRSKRKFIAKPHKKARRRT